MIVAKDCAIVVAEQPHTCRLPTTVNVNGGDLTSSHQSTGLTSTSSLLLIRYPNLFSDESNEDDKSIAVIDSFEKINKIKDETLDKRGKVSR